MGSQPASMEIFLLCFFFFDVLLFMLMMRRFRPKSGMKNCNLLNRIVPPARQSRRNFTNESAENLGTKLYNGHIGTIGRPVMTSRNYPASSIYAVRSRPSFFHHQPPAGVRAIHKKCVTYAWGRADLPAVCRKNYAGCFFRETLHGARRVRCSAFAPSFAQKLRRPYQFHVASNLSLRFAALRSVRA